MIPDSADDPDRSHRLGKSSGLRQGAPQNKGSPPSGSGSHAQLKELSSSGFVERVSNNDTSDADHLVSNAATKPMSATDQQRALN